MKESRLFVYFFENTTSERLWQKGALSTSKCWFLMGFKQDVIRKPSHTPLRTTSQFRRIEASFHALLISVGMFKISFIIMRRWSENLPFTASDRVLKLPKGIFIVIVSYLPSKTLRKLSSVPLNKLYKLLVEQYISKLSWVSFLQRKSWLRCLFWWYIDTSSRIWSTILALSDTN